MRPGVGLEAARGLGGDPALDGAAVGADVLLPEAQVRQAPALSHVDLGMDQVHTAGWGRGREGGMRQGDGCGQPWLTLPADPHQPRPDHAQAGSPAGSA